MPFLRTFSTSRRIGRPSESMPARMASTSTPASINAASVMSPLMPLKQSKWATFTRVPSARVILSRIGLMSGGALREQFRNDLSRPDQVNRLAQRIGQFGLGRDAEQAVEGGNEVVRRHRILGRVTADAVGTAEDEAALDSP